MTNINCSSNCIYQKDGKCHLDNVYNNNNKLTPNKECAYYSENNKNGCPIGDASKWTKMSF